MANLTPFYRCSWPNYLNHLSFSLSPPKLTGTQLIEKEYIVLSQECTLVTKALVPFNSSPPPFQRIFCYGQRSSSSFLTMLLFRNSAFFEFRLLKLKTGFFFFLRRSPHPEQGPNSHPTIKSWAENKNQTQLTEPPKCPKTSFPTALSMRN